eukprot:CAMPEP_0168364826 /NCGR_PEP_ID=MMETSP0228-20121227/4404_1 /TAXON_ID=133427 /ORGANISM="Protoceratium reticulatum, Strain CCCM 535 (=CCMP 1889)" /LENGTH=73 /DNA_ID=CAMNT_0008377591 /DNA_START=9 /DNA_END=226 /DNA_ORIENTATION=+
MAEESCFYAFALSQSRTGKERPVWTGLLTAVPGPAEFRGDIYFSSCCPAAPRDLSGADSDGFRTGSGGTTGAR